mmetsp:Transcript_9229/g.24244  ORF Transcript_9229/g.24244 Transcript_9229/m.24244 type:complete len:217 (-) Transcript_9229:628-1278(-)
MWSPCTAMDIGVVPSACAWFASPCALSSKRKARSSSVWTARKTGELMPGDTVFTAALASRRSLKALRRFCMVATSTGEAPSVRVLFTSTLDCNKISSAAMLLFSTAANRGVLPTFEAELPSTSAVSTGVLLAFEVPFTSAFISRSRCKALVLFFSAALESREESMVHAARGLESTSSNIFNASTLSLSTAWTNALRPPYVWSRSAPSLRISAKASQ